MWNGRGGETGISRLPMNPYRGRGPKSTQIDQIWRIWCWFTAERLIGGVRIVQNGIGGTYGVTGKTWENGWLGNWCFWGTKVPKIAKFRLWSVWLEVLRFHYAFQGTTVSGWTYISGGYIVSLLPYFLSETWDFGWFFGVVCSFKGGFIGIWCFGILFSYPYCWYLL